MHGPIRYLTCLIGAEEGSLPLSGLAPAFGSEHFRRRVQGVEGACFDSNDVLCLWAPLQS